MKSSKNVWIAFLLNFSFAIIEFIFELYLTPVLYWQMRYMIQEMP